MASAHAESPSASAAATGILLGGLTAGLLDITYACIRSGLRGRSPLWVLQSVASGLMGSSAFECGVPAGALGPLCHFVIALGAAAVYYVAARHIPVLRQRRFRRVLSSESSSISS